jgi:inhibitor of KinA
VDYRIFPVSESVVTIEFGNEISVEANDRVIRLAEVIGQNRFPGLIETVPAYSSLTIFFDLPLVRRNFPEYSTAFSFVKSFVENSLILSSENSPKTRRAIRIPVDYGFGSALDLEFVAQNSGLSVDDVIEIHTSRVYRVFMVGFLPGFAYMGEVDQRIATPRKQTPRVSVPRGSVGIAGKQTGIYPLESPGGWQIIGRTSVELFQPESRNISRLKTGDLVQFYDLRTTADDANL